MTLHVYLYSTGLRVLCSGPPLGHTWQQFIGRVLQFGVVQVPLISLCVMIILRFVFVFLSFNLTWNSVFLFNNLHSGDIICRLNSLTFPLVRNIWSPTAAMNQAILVMLMFVFSFLLLALLSAYFSMVLGLMCFFFPRGL